MLLQFPPRRYSAALIISVLMHVVLLSLLFQYSARREYPAHVQWIELAEMNFSKPTNLLPRTRPQPQPNDDVKPTASKKLKEHVSSRQKPAAATPAIITEKSDISPIALETLKVNPLATPESKRPVPIRTTPPPGKIPASPEPDKITTTDAATKTPPSLSSVLGDAQRFRLSRKGYDKPQNPPVISSSLESLLNRMNMVPLNKTGSVKPVRLRLNDADARNYRKRLNEFFSKHWEVPVNLANSPLTVVVLIIMKRDGQVESYDIEQKSENEELDLSIVELLKNLQFLPALPDSYLEHTYEIGFRFTPLDFQF